MSQENYVQSLFSWGRQFLTDLEHSTFALTEILLDTVSGECSTYQNSKEDILEDIALLEQPANPSGVEHSKLLEQPRNPNGVEYQKQPTNPAGVESQEELKNQLGPLVAETYQTYQNKTLYQSKTPNRCGVLRGQPGFQPTQAIENLRTSNQDTSMYDHDWGGVHGYEIRIDLPIGKCRHLILPGPTKIYVKVHINSLIGELMWGWSANSPLVGPFVY